LKYTFEISSSIPPKKAEPKKAKRNEMLINVSFKKNKKKDISKYTFEISSSIPPKKAEPKKAKRNETLINVSFKKNKKETF
jgi:hypothetical protein